MGEGYMDYPDDSGLSKNYWRVPDRTLLRAIYSLEDAKYWDDSILQIFNPDYRSFLEIDNVRDALKFMIEYRVSIQDDYRKSGGEVILNLKKIKKYREANQEYEVLRLLHGIDECYQEFDLSDERSEVYSMIRQEFVNL